MTLARQPITQGAHRLEPETLAARLAELPGWTLTPDGGAIRRTWRLRDFRQATGGALPLVASMRLEPASPLAEALVGMAQTTCDRFLATCRDDARAP